MTVLKYALAYIRVSRDDLNKDNQRLALLDWAKQNGYTIIEFFEDLGISGKIPAIQRKGFSSMLEFLKNNVQQMKVDAVLVYELSRLGRSFRETLDAVWLLDRYAPLISCSAKEAFLQTVEPSFRNLILSVLSWCAERERELLIQRTREGLNRARAEGTKLGRPRKAINEKELLTLLAKDVPKKHIAKMLDVSAPTLYRKMASLGLKKEVFLAS